MADNHHEHPGPDEPQPGSAPEGDFPADFFDDAHEPPPVPQSLAEHRPAPSPSPSPSPPTPPRPPADELTRTAASASRPTRVEPPPDVERSRLPVFATVLGAALLGVLGTAWYVNRQQGAEPAPGQAPSSSTPTSASTPGPTPATSSEATTASGGGAVMAGAVDNDGLEAKVKELTGKVDELSAQVKAFEGKLNDLPKPEPAPDLKPLEGKVGDLTKSVAAVGPLGDKVDKLDGRVGSLGDELKSIKDEVTALKDEARKAAPAASDSKSAAEDVTAAMAGGVELFKAGKYKEADEVFKKLAAGNPKDARVYYYAALTRGLTTKDWQGGETMAAAAKGAELEKAGSPKASEIDSTFADVPSSLKPWVAYFRRQAK